jgi:hypothetical protein
MANISSAEEIKEALFSIHPHKALGPNGFHSLFFQTYWHICGERITNAIINIFSSGTILVN